LAAATPFYSGDGKPNTSGTVNRPSFFIAGHSKCGTTALARFLHQHPSLFVCDPEEPNYFCPSFCRAPGPPSRFFRRSEAEYLSLFEAAGPDQLCGEASAAYLYSEEAAELIHEFDPQARIIMIFREPVDFLRSYHLQMLKNTPAEGETVRDLGEAIRLEPERREGRQLPDGCLIPEFLHYATDRLRYDEHFIRFADRFPSDRILAMTYDDFRRDNQDTVRRVFDFLEVDAEFQPQLGEHNTGGKELRSRRLQSLLHTATHGTGVTARARRVLPKRLRQKAIGAAYDRVAFQEAARLDDQLASAIRDRAAPHVAALGDRLGRDLLAEWDYANVEPSRS
jgi:sulfotransferase family protein